MPQNPSAPAPAMASRGKMPCASHSETCGASSPDAKSRATRWNARCSADNSKSIDAGCRRLERDGGVDARRAGVVEPAFRDGLGLRVEQYDLLAVRSQVTELGCTRPGERKQRHRHGNRNIDADLTDVDLFLELT